MADDILLGGGEERPEREWVDCGIDLIDRSSLRHLLGRVARERLPRDRPAEWIDVMEAGRGLRAHLGIRDRVWNEGGWLIGPHAMSILLIVAAVRIEARDEDLGCGGDIDGWVRGCLKKAEQGELHLHGIVEGLLGGGDGGVH